MPKPKKHVTEFAARLTVLRKAAGYTQVELAAALGTTQRMIAYYESRAEKAPAALLPQMAEALVRLVSKFDGPIFTFDDGSVSR
jgi:transcriptional regulator with XRE-family HTH domain